MDQEKSITVVELEKKGTVRTSLLPLKPLRDMRKLRGTYLELTDRSFYRDMNREDYIQVTLTDEDDVPARSSETACDLPEYHAAFV